MTTDTAADPLALLVVEDVDAGFAAVVEVHASLVYGIARRLTRRRVDAEDLAADTFARAYAALRRADPSAVLAIRFRPWLVTIVRNCWRNDLRSAARRPIEEAEVDLADPTPLGPEDAALASIGGSRIEQALASLPDPQRWCVLLRHVTGLSVAEVADALAMAENTVKSHTARGRASLRRALEEGGKPR